MTFTRMARGEVGREEFRGSLKFQHSGAFEGARTCRGIIDKEKAAGVTGGFESQYLD